MLNKILLPLLLLIFFTSSDIFAGHITSKLLCTSLMESTRKLVSINDEDERKEILKRLFEDSFAADKFLENVLWKYRDSIDDNKRKRIEYLFPKTLIKNIETRLKKISPKDVFSFKLEKINKDNVALFNGYLKNENIKLEAFLINIDGQWKIVDVSVEGANMRDNYEGQFSRIIDKYGVDELIRRLEKKSK